MDSGAARLVSANAENHPGPRVTGDYGKVSPVRPHGCPVRIPA